MTADAARVIPRAVAPASTVIDIHSASDFVIDAAVLAALGHIPVAPYQTAFVAVSLAGAQLVAEAGLKIVLVTFSLSVPKSPSLLSKLAPSTFHGELLLGKPIAP